MSLFISIRKIRNFTYLQFDPEGQSESLQHSRHLLKGHTPQQFPESHWLFFLHPSPFGQPDT